MNSIAQQILLFLSLCYMGNSEKLVSESLNSKLDDTQTPVQPTIEDVHEFLQNLKTEENEPRSAQGVKMPRQSPFTDIGDFIASLQQSTPTVARNTAAGCSNENSLFNMGVYVPDQRFNAFVDGIMVNMVAEMKRRRMDPLYFRVYSQGIVEHVQTRGKRSVFSVMEDRREGRQTASLGSSGTPNQGTALGGGVIRGLTNIKRFGNAEVQVAGNTTLIRAHWLKGPLKLIMDFRGNPITRAKTELEAVQFDTLTSIDRFGAEMQDFRILRPLFDFMPYYGNRTLEQQQTAELVVKHLFSANSFMNRLFSESFADASYDKIIPQFGADNNYYSMLRHLFKGRRKRSVL